MNFLKLLTLIFVIFFSNQVKADDDKKYRLNYQEDEFTLDEFDFISTKKSDNINDPLEGVNRKIYIFNDYADKIVLEPVARGYRAAIPSKIRDSVRNFLKNSSLPFTIINSIIQRDVENTMASSSTFLINSTVGLFGLFDVAGKKRIRYDNEDFGQTLAVYGLPQGPYLMLPLMGPSNVRDFAGDIINRVVDPLSFNLLKIGGDYNIVHDRYRISISSLSLIDKREGLIEAFDYVRKDSFDPYTTIKSSYVQTRNNEISK